MGKADKRLQLAIKCATAEGWTLDRTTRGHPRLTPPDGWDFPEGVRTAPRTAPGTPSDHRGLDNFISDLRRCGVPIPHKGYTPSKCKREES